MSLLQKGDKGKYQDKWVFSYLPALQKKNLGEE